jgi:hypothetical protein
MKKEKIQDLEETTNAFVLEKVAQHLRSGLVLVKVLQTEQQSKIKYLEANSGRNSEDGIPCFEYVF